MYYKLICILYAHLCGQHFILVKSGCYMGVVPITTTIEGSKMCLEYHIFHHPSPTFILVGVPLRALLRGADNGECLKMVWVIKNS
jgi:hypothetical protein